eukprot:TRINITY_DN71337_c0_g1_i1.p4 TRINITY_DN71337_c0_g1~~TRINITY_DN71337_c0_g1_i1.p4  ORF type:complete len:105 (+),score=30.35 TRINITY_DN71337_c0_g1_i1:47-361(+)
MWKGRGGKEMGKKKKEKKKKKKKKNTIEHWMERNGVEETIKKGTFKKEANATETQQTRCEKKQNVKGGEGKKKKEQKRVVRGGEAKEVEKIIHRTERERRIIRK